VLKKFVSAGLAAPPWLRRTSSVRFAEAAIIDAGSSCRNTEFASPEQFTGTDVDIRYDLYSLGITLRQMLTGHRRFEELRSVRMGSADCMSGQPGRSALLAWLKTTV
jgi:hypothetical protein